MEERKKYEKNRGMYHVQYNSAVLKKFLKAAPGLTVFPVEGSLELNKSVAL